AKMPIVVRHWMRNIHPCLLLAAVATPGCTGKIGDTGGGGQTMPACHDISQVRRLTTREYMNTLVDLLRIGGETVTSVEPEQRAFYLPKIAEVLPPAQQLPGIFSNQADLLTVIGLTAEGYADAAEYLADMLANGSYGTTPWLNLLPCYDAMA